MHNISLKTKQAFISILFGLFPLIIIVSVFFSYVFNMLENDRTVSNYYNVQNVATALENTIANVNEMSQFIIGNEYIRKFLSTTCADGTDEYNRIYSKAYDQLLLLPFGTKVLYSIGVFQSDSKSLVVGSEWSMDISKEEIEMAKNLKGKWFWSANEKTIYMCRLLRDKNDVSNDMGYIKISINKSFILKLFASTKNYPNASFALLDIKTGNTLFDNLDDETKKFLTDGNINLKDLIENEKVSSQVKIGNTLYSGMKWELSDKKTIVFSLTPDLSSRYKHIFEILIISVLLVTIVMVVSQIWLSNRWMIKPLTHLGSLMKSIESEDFSVRFNINGNDEIAVLAQQFNLMSDKLQFLYNEVYQSNLKMKDAEIKLLQSEINPHFLFNTLNTIYWMVSSGDKLSAGKTIQAMSNLFRISLFKSSDGLIPLSVEIEHVKCYLQIQQMRFENKIIFTIDMHENLLKLKVLKLVLQPIVENAILHGIEPKQGGEIIVSVYIMDNTLCYNIYDSGVGADPEKINKFIESDQSDGSHGRALHNVNERLKLKFGKEYGLSYQCPADGGSTFIVKQPIIQVEGRK